MTTTAASLLIMRTHGRDDGTSLQLTSGIELLDTPGGVTMAYVPTTRRYVRLSPIAADLVAQLQTRGEGTPPVEPVPASLLRAAGSAAVTPVQVSTLLHSLERAGILQSPGRASVFHRGRWPVLRLPLWCPSRVLLPRTCVAFCERHSARLVPLATLLVALAITAIGAATWRAGTLLRAPASWSAWSTLLALHVLLHEAAHGLTAGRYGVPIREFGVGLLYWCIPVAYTDRTDAYRLRTATAVAAIAAAGPVFDIVAMGVTATCLLAGWTGATGQALLTAQLALALANLNPLLPGDAYHFASSLLGRPQARRDAFALLAHLLRHGRPPTRLAHLSTRQRSGYVVYAVAATLYLLVVLTLPAITILDIFDGRVGQ